MAGSPEPRDVSDSATTPDGRLMTPSDIELLFRSGPQLQSHDDEDDGITLADEELSRRVEKLGHVLATVHKLFEAGSEELDALAQKIGDGSRDASWRKPIGESGLLDFFLGVVGSQGVRPAITTQALRIIGNSCADTDENRARVVASNCMPRIVNLLTNDSTLAFAIPVLFNICVDYEPAQAAAYKAGLNPALVNLVSGPRLSNAKALMGIICKLLALIANQEPVAELVHPATPFVLLTIATSPQSLDEIEDFLGPTSVALTYLSNQVFQQSFLQTPEAVPLLLQAFYQAFVALDTNVADPDEAKQLRSVRSIFTQGLADVSANPLFETSCPIDGPESRTLQRWLDGPSTELQSAACLVLGNIARSDEACVALVHKFQLYRPLVAILSNSSNTDAQLLHSTLSFLKNLAIPANNKQALGEAGLLAPNVLPRAWELDTQVQVQFTAVSLTRLLLVSTPANVGRICAPIDADPSDKHGQTTLLQKLISLFLRSDQEPTKVEAARAVAAVTRVLHSNPDTVSLVFGSTNTSSANPTPTPGMPLASSSALKAFYTSHEAITKALVYLGEQKKFPILRSDLWFVMALMSRSPDGAEVVVACLQQAELLRSLVEAVAGVEILEERGLGTLAAADVSLSESDPVGGSQSPEGITVVGGEGLEAAGQLPGLQGLEPQQVDPAQKAGMARVDRENGLVLVAELLQRCPEKLQPIFPLDTLQEILRVGGERVLSDRDNR